MAQVKCYKWNDADMKWKDANFTWKESCVVIELIQALGGPNTSVVKAYRSLSKDKKRILVTLITKIASMDKEYDDYRSELTKEKSSRVNVTIKDVEILAKAVLGIQIEVKNVGKRKKS